MTRIDITIHVTLPRPETEGERLARTARCWARSLERIAQQRIAMEKAAGNPLFARVDTWDQYVAACDADDRQKRKKLGFWRYYFG